MQGFTRGVTGKAGTRQSADQVQPVRTSRGRRRSESMEGVGAGSAHTCPELPGAAARPAPLRVLPLSAAGQPAWRVSEVGSSERPRPGRVEEPAGWRSRPYKGSRRGRSGQPRGQL